jgi:hypothetical protein
MTNILKFRQTWKETKKNASANTWLMERGYEKRLWWPGGPDVFQNPGGYVAACVADVHLPTWAGDLVNPRFLSRWFSVLGGYESGCHFVKWFLKFRIWGSHSADYEEYHVLPKCQLTLNRLHGVIAKKMVLFSFWNIWMPVFSSSLEMWCLSCMVVWRCGALVVW